MRLKEELSKIDVTANRSAVKWSVVEKLRRIFWACIYIFFRLSPRPFWGWRSALLRFSGARVGGGLRIYPDVEITIPWNLSIGNQVTIGRGAILYALGPIEIGDRVTISQRSHLCAGTHDFRSTSFELIKEEIIIGDDVWIAAEAFVGPGLNIGQAAVVAARAVIVKSVERECIVAGNPARTIAKSR